MTSPNSSAPASQWSVNQVKKLSGSSCYLFLLALFCLTWLFRQILSRFSVDFNGLWRWITTLIQMKFFGENFIFEVRVFIKIKIYSVTWFNVFKFCHFNSCQIMQRLFLLLPKQCRPLWMVNKCCYPKNLGFWRSILTSSEKMVGGVCYISVLLSKSPHWLVH